MSNSDQEYSDELTFKSEYTPAKPSQVIMSILTEKMKDKQLVVIREDIGFMANADVFTSLDEYVERLINDREQQLLDRIADEVIKEDEAYNTSPKSLKSPLIKIRYRNELRKQQRARLAAIRSNL